MSENNYSKIYFYYDCNRSKRGLQNIIVHVYFIIWRIRHNWCQTLPAILDHALKTQGLGYASLIFILKNYVIWHQSRNKP